MKVEISDHAEKRIRKRFGVKRKAVPNVVKQAMDNGVRVASLSGKVKRWFDRQSIIHKSGNNSVFYSGFCFVINNNVVITAYEIPKNLNQ